MQEPSTAFLVTESDWRVRPCHQPMNAITCNITVIVYQIAYALAYKRQNVSTHWR